MVVSYSHCGDEYANVHYTYRSSTIESRENEGGLGCPRSFISGLVHADWLQRYGLGRGSDFGVGRDLGKGCEGIKLWSLLGQAPWVCIRSSGAEDAITSYVQSYGHLS